ncbi:MAG TPA: hypothetical protein VF595_02110 [Tepidisphaeraceae bacterium]|jgi:tetratricopeptide (TPR) repeat protein
MRYACAIPLVLLTAAVLRAGTIVTTDGETLVGELKRTEEGWNVTQDDGQVKSVELRKVKSIELDGGARKPGREVAGLQSLRRSVEFSDDLPRIIQRYQTFINQTKDAAVIAQAKQDMVLWQDRVDRGLVKFGRAWITPEDRDAKVRDLRQRAERIRLLLKDRRDREADAALNELLNEDPQNVSGLYLRGVLSQKRQDFVEARKAFQAVQQALPNHAPTLLNLTLVLARQRQWPAACVALEQSLESTPVSQVLLDTAAEFINLLPPETKRGTAAQKLLRTFLDQDARLQKIMLTRQLYRWGAGWIDKPTYDAIRQDNDAVQKKLVDLQKQFDATQASITQIDNQIGENQRAMRDIESHSYVQAPDGAMVRVPLPRAWYQLQSDIARLTTERSEAQAKLETMRVEARDTQRSLRTPTYSGVLRPIDEDGIPLPVLPDDSAVQPPTTAPATQSTTGPSNTIRVGPPDVGR